jgi:ribonuclease J
LSHPHPELTLPPPLPDNGLRFVALGGLGEIGRNMTVIEHAGQCSSSTAACSSPTTTTPGST